MKNSDLLEAIGYADEQFLCELEQRPKKKAHPVRRLVLIAAVVALFAVTVMAGAGIWGGLLRAGENGASMENLSSGMGSFLYSEGSVYYGTFGCIYQCDLNGNVLKTYSLSSEQERPCYMFASEDALIYTVGLSATALTVQPKDGSEPYTVDVGGEITNAYADGHDLYTNSGGSMLCRINLVTLEKTELLEEVSSYFVDDSFIYAVQSKNEKVIHRSAKDTIGFEVLPLDFIPNKVVAHGEELYLCQWLGEGERAAQTPYRISLMKDGTVTDLPVYSWLYQVMDGCILYLEGENNSLYSYHLTTGEKSVIQENVFAFSVFEDRYICIERYNQAPLIYDSLTGLCDSLAISE